MALQVVVAGGPTGEPALAQTEVLALSLADVAVLGPHEAPELVVDVTLERPDRSTSSALIKHFSSDLLCLFVCSSIMKLNINFTQV